MTVKGGTSQACAACKYQRRKCSDQCPLAPYFPASNPKMFQNAHRLFGVSNMMKILKQVNEDQKHDAMQSIIYESNMRQRFPVHGCCGIIRHLHQQLQQAVDELYNVRSRLQMFREQQFHSQNTNHSNNRPLPLPPSPSEPSNYSSSSQLQQPMIQSNYIPLYPYQCDQQQHHHPVGPSNQLLTNANKESCLQINEKRAKSIWGQPNFDIINGNGSMEFHLPFFNTPVPIPNPIQMGVPQNPIQLGVPQGYDNIPSQMGVPQSYDNIPSDIIADDKQSHIGYRKRGVYDSSSEESLKGTTRSIPKSELKTAASSFSLPSHQHKLSQWKKKK